MCVAEIPREARTLKAYGQQKRLRQQRDLTNGCKSPRSLAAQRQASAAVPSMTSSIVEKIACYVNHGLSTTSRARPTGARAAVEEAPTHVRRFTEWRPRSLRYRWRAPPPRGHSRSLVLVAIPGTLFSHLTLTVNTLRHCILKVRASYRSQTPLCRGPRERARARVTSNQTRASRCRGTDAA